MCFKNTDKMDDKQKQFIRDNYPTKGKMWCCEQLGLTEGQIRSFCSGEKIKLDQTSDFFKDFQRRAKDSKIGKKRPIHSNIMKEKANKGLLDNFIKCSEEKKKKISEHNKKWIEENGHPKGMLGKTHSDLSKKLFSEINKERWKDPNYILNSEESRQKKSDMMTFSRKFDVTKQYSRGKKGWVEIGGKNYFYRSSWEPNVASYLEFLKKSGEIKDWSYEEDTFWFDKIKRGVRSYKPDFKITKNDDTFYYEEVKGYMDSKSKTKLNRMRIYYPKIDIRVLDQKRYKEIEKSKNLFPEWGE